MSLPKIKLYKEPTILVIVLIVSFAAMIFAFMGKFNMDTNATVDNVVPLPLEVEGRESANQRDEQTDSNMTSDGEPAGESDGKLELETPSILPNKTSTSETLPEEFKKTLTGD